MKVLVQVVKRASVSIDDRQAASIGPGVLYFVGFTKGDNLDLIDKMIIKLLKLRIFADSEGKTNLSLDQVGGSILSVSQFTLYADVKGGNRPSFTRSLPGSESQGLFHYFNSRLNALGYKVETGVFGANMQVSLINDGPFTIMIDSEELYG